MYRRFNRQTTPVYNPREFCLDLRPGGRHHQTVTPLLLGPDVELIPRCLEDGDHRCLCMEEQNHLRPPN